VAVLLEENVLAPGELCLEISEADLLEEWWRCRESLDALVAMGARLALDDFGAGYSSLAHLHAFRVNTLKIDRKFVERLGGGNGDVSIVGGVVAMAHALDMSVVAEGVETESELRKVTEMECDEAQGFLFARPLTAVAVSGLLASQPGSALSA
jgi:EAL domain-containing protein (putative c-di-GMP-specific phosphodiesterase class I)